MKLHFPGIQFVGPPGLVAAVGLDRMPLAPFHGLGGPAHNHSYLGYLLNGLLQCTLHGAVFEEHPEATAGTKKSVCAVMCILQSVHVALLLHELHWLPYASRLNSTCSL